MGIQAESLHELRGICLGLPQDFAVCELGDQRVTADGEEQLARRWFQKNTHCGRYECIDANGRAGAIPLDLNAPLAKTTRGAALVGQFDLATDFGTGEHVFNQFECWRTLHDLVKENGVIVFDRPSAGYEGHCFYLIQWNLISALAHANWYHVIYLRERVTTRGVILGGALLKRKHKKFVHPQQGRYVPDLIVDDEARRRGPDWRSKELRAAGIVGRRAEPAQKEAAE